jgi:excisionase family DNA binding protein
MTVKEAAERMKVTPMFIMMGLRQGRLPFGVAVKFKRWRYYINERQFQEFLKEGRS